MIEINYKANRSLIIYSTSTLRKAGQSIRTNVHYDQRVFRMLLVEMAGIFVRAVDENAQWNRV